METSPRVSVLMPAYNAESHIDAAIRSILDQTWNDLDLLLLDDGSTDRSLEIMEKYRDNDARVSLHRFPRAGLVPALNRGIDLARGTYLLRADGDDISLPDRVARQVEFMEQHPEIGLCGGCLETVPGGDRWNMPTDPETIHCHLVFGVSVSHPTWIVRREWIEECGLRYDSEYTHAEDYDLLERAARQSVLANLPTVLVRYREHDAQVSRIHNAAQALAARRVRKRQIERLGIDATCAELDLHDNISQISYPTESDFLHRSQLWLERLAAANAAAQVYPQPAFSRVLADRLYRLYAESPALRPSDCLAFGRTALGSTSSRSWQRRTRLFLRGILPTAIARRLARATSALATPGAPPRRPLDAAKALSNCRDAARKL